MGHKNKIGIVLLLLLFISANQLVANDVTEAFKRTPLEQKVLNLEEWNKERDGLKYTTKPAVTKEKYKASNTSGFSMPRTRALFDIREVARGVLIFIAALLLVFLIVRVLAGDAILSSKGIKRTAKADLVALEENLHEADVESFLTKALKRKEYKLAVRLYYLSIIKSLSISGAIEWKKDKTNGDYLRELRYKKDNRYDDFYTVTRIFEYVWYNEVLFGQHEFEEIQPTFKQTLQSVN